MRSIALRLVWKAAETWRGRSVAALGLVFAATLYLFPGLVKDGVTPYAALGIIVAAALGTPIFTVLGGLALLMFWSAGVPSAAVPGETYRLAASPMLPAIPLFTLGGYLFSESGASRRLMRTFTSLVGWMPGGLAVVTTLLLAFFTPFTGASGVTILSMGGLLLPMMVKARYPEGTSVGLVTVAGSIGLLFPPSLPVIDHVKTFVTGNPEGGSVDAEELRKTPPHLRLWQASFYFRFYMAEALAKAGMGKQSWALLAPFFEALNRGSTTWPEAFEPCRSECHAWTSWPLYFFHRHVLGVNPPDSADGGITVAPLHCPPLDRIQGTTATHRGPVNVRINWQGATPEVQATGQGVRVRKHPIGA